VVAGEDRGVIGFLLIYGTVTAVVVELREAIGAMAYVSFIIPIIALAYMLANFREFPRSSITLIVGIGLVAIMFLLGG
jgi:hypothetical protein